MEKSSEQREIATNGFFDKELMEVLAGSMDIRLQDTDAWHTYAAGSSFEVSANSSFDLKVTEVADYCCSYIS
jgi:uncharacterized protein YaiE (UPF0345 family)